MNNLIKKYKHIILALYAPIYLICFFFLERKVTTDFTALNSPIDDIIPFIPVFIIPYILWFFYIAASAIYFFLVSQRDFIKLMSFLITGMTAYLIICYIFPNGLQNFRPAQLDAKSPFYGLISWLYATDTSTNVFPSIHVYNSIGVHIAIIHSEKIHHKSVRIGSLILCILICLSTIFMKQHALIDVIGGCVMGQLVYRMVYKTKYSDLIDRKAWA